MQKTVEQKTSADYDLIRLRDKAYEIAKRHLSTRAAMPPFGLAMTPDGTVGKLKATPGQDSSSAQFEQLRNALTNQARKTTLKAAAIARVVSVTDRATGELTDAVAVQVDHRENGSIEVYFPFKIDCGTPNWGTAFQQAGRRTIFS